MLVVAILKKWLLPEGFNKHEHLDWQAGCRMAYSKGAKSYIGGGLIVMELLSGFLK